MQGTLSSELLLRVVTPGELFPDMRAALAEMQSVTDWAEAEATGRVEPAEVRRAAGWGCGRMHPRPGAVPSERAVLLSARRALVRLTQPHPGIPCLTIHPAGRGRSV